MSKLIDNVIKQRGEKLAIKLHSQIIQESFKIETDDKINPINEDYVDYDTVKANMIDSAIKELNKLKGV